MPNQEDFPKTDQNQVRRIPNRGHYDRKTIYEILDAGFLCHVGFVVDDQPYVIPTLYGRQNDTLYFHGAASSRMLRSLNGGIPICVTITHVDALVIARSAFHHSMNYRSAVLFGKAALIVGEQKSRALFSISENILAGRWQEVRLPNELELKATSVLGMTIESASAKIRTGPPLDDEEDYDLPIWAGTVPIVSLYGSPEPDPKLSKAIPISPSVASMSMK